MKEREDEAATLDDLVHGHHTRLSGPALTGTGEGEDAGVRAGKRLAESLEPAAGGGAARQGTHAEGARDSGVPEGEEGRLRGRRPVWRGLVVDARQGGRLLQDDRGVLRNAGRRPGVRVRDVLHEREGARRP